MIMARFIRSFRHKVFDDIIKIARRISLVLVLGTLATLSACSPESASTSSSAEADAALAKVKGADMTVYELYKENKGKRPGKATEYAEIFLSKADTAATNPAIAEMASFLADYYENDREVYPKALAFSKTAARIYAANNMRKPLAKQLLCNARLYLRLERLDSALMSVHGASLGIEKDDAESLIDYNKIMGVIFHKAGDEELAHRYLRESTRIAYEDTAGKDLPQNINNEATLSFRTENDKKKSIQLLNEAVDKAEKSNDTEALSTLYANLAGAYSSVGDYASAMKFCRKAEPVTKSISQKGHLATVKAQIYIQKDSIPKAIESLQSALACYGQGEFPGLTLNLYENLASLYKSVGDNEMSYKYLYAYKNLYDSIGWDETLKKLYALHNRFSEEEIEKSVSERADSRLFVILSAIALLLGVAVVASVYWMRKKTARLVEARLDRRIKEENSVMQIRCFRCCKIIGSAMERLNQAVERTRNSKLAPELREISGMLKETQNDSTTREIEQYIPDFDSEMYRRLIKDFPNLTPNESRICVLVAKNMSTKQISDITRQSNEAVKMARTRLRSKLGLTGSKTSLQEFLNKYKS